MTITETKPDEGHLPVASDTSNIDLQPIPAPPKPGPAALLGTADHKVVGRLYLIFSLLLLAGSLVLAALVSAEGMKANQFDLLDLDTYFQVFTLSRVGLVFLGLIPALLGLATYIVPLQVGASTIAFPRAAAASFWGWLFGGGLVIAGWAINGGPGGGSLEGVLLSLAAWLLVLGSLTIGWVCVATTVAALRPEGMSLLRTPIFAWSCLVAGSVFVLTLPILASNLLLIYVDVDHDQLLFGQPQNIWPQLAWIVAQPAVYALLIPVLGIACEAVPVMARRRPAGHGANMIAIGFLGALSLGGWAQTAFNPALVREALFIGVSFAAVLPVFVVSGGLADNLRRGRPRAAAALPLSLFAVLLGLGAVLAGAVHTVDPLNLVGTTWGDAVFKAVVAATVTGLVAGLHFWGPKLWGGHPVEALGKLNVLVLLAGATLFTAGDLIAGGLGQAQADSTGSVAKVVDGAEILASLSALGGVMLFLGVVLALLALLPAAMGRKRSGAIDNPWVGNTLEWATTSPPPYGNFLSEVGPVTSACPLLDALESTAEVS